MADEAIDPTRGAAAAAAQAKRQREIGGGPAFAALAVGPAGDVYEQPGMTLRDWFAAQALVGELASEVGAEQIVLSGREEGGGPFEVAARMAYRFADAMLVERAK